MLLQRDVGVRAIVNSGVIFATSVELADPFEDMGVQTVGEVAMRISEIAGDGTAAVALLAQAMVYESLKIVAAGPPRERGPFLAPARA